MVFSKKILLLTNTSVSVVSKKIPTTVLIAMIATNHISHYKSCVCYPEKTVQIKPVFSRISVASEFRYTGFIFYMVYASQFTITVIPCVSIFTL